METIQWIINSVSYWNIFVILFLSGLGFPVPEEVTFMAAGAAASMGHLEVAPMLVLCYLAVIGGDALAFGGGRFLGNHLYQSRLARFLLNPKRMRKARYLFYKRGTWAVVIARFLPGLRVSAFFVAGSMGVKWPRFLVADSLALIGSAPVGLLLGWFLGASLLTEEGFARAQHVLREYHIAIGVVAGALVLTVVALLLLRGYKRRKRKAERASLRPPPAGVTGG
ncbi:MAG: DedA family protein [Deltaproteobacteria bacterium]|nr:DedA family protein [Deltaproteobacteria bacterium]